MLEVITEVDRILGIIKKQNLKLIAINGINGVGKTYLARSISSFFFDFYKKINRNIHQ